MDLSSAEILTIITAIGVLVGTVGAVIVNIIIALRTGAKVSEVVSTTNAIAQITDKSLAKTTILQGQIKEVHTATNSTLESVKAELRQATAQVESLHSVVYDLRMERDKATLSAAFKTPVLTEGKLAAIGIEKVSLSVLKTADEVSTASTTVEDQSKSRTRRRRSTD